MTRILFVLIVLLGAVACSGCHTGPQERIAQERMALILMDIQQSHQYVNAQPWTSGRKDTVGAQLYQEILRRHDVSREALRETLDYLAENPAAFQQVINRSIDSANVELLRKQQQQMPQPLHPLPPATPADSAAKPQGLQASSGGSIYRPR